MASSVHVKDLQQEQRILNARSVMAVSVALGLTLILISKLIYLQVIRHDYYLDLSQGNRIRHDPIPASRGLILDRHGTVLVNNEPTYQLELIREQTKDVAATLERLRQMGLLTEEEVEQAQRAIKSRRSFDSVPIRLRMTDEEIGRFAVHKHEFQGVDLRTRETRHYPYDELGVHAFGYVAAISEDDLKRIKRLDDYAGTTLIGKLGIEAAYEDALHGTNGFRNILVNAQGRSVETFGQPAAQLGAAAPIAGKDLVLSIDLPAQQAAEAALAEHRGSVVAIDPANGDVIALVSRPGFNPTQFGRGIRRLEYAALTGNPDRPLLNRALQGTYPSGSTIKPIFALAGLHYNVVDAGNREFCTRSYHLPGSSHLFREGKTNHGNVDLRDAIAKSCDIFFYRLANRLGVEHMAEFIRPFGFGAVTGIDISGERTGLVPSPEWKKSYFKKPQDQVWFPGETINFGVGQGYFLVTPLQLAHAATILANRGKSFKPRLVASIRNVNGKLTPVAPVVGDTITDISDEHWNIALEGMVGTTTYGTAAGQFIKAGYTVAGKTGTAQVYSVGQNEKYRGDKDERLRDHSWFIAFAPAEAPRIAICVLVENGGFGASVAAPIARRVIDAYFTSNNIIAPVAAPIAAPVAQPVAKTPPPQT